MHVSFLRLVLAMAVLVCLVLSGWQLREMYLARSPAEVAREQAPLTLRGPSSGRKVVPPQAQPLLANDPPPVLGHPIDITEVNPPRPLLATTDKQLLENAGIATDGPDLLDFFRQRTLTPDEHQ